MTCGKCAKSDGDKIIISRGSVSAFRDALSKSGYAVESMTKHEGDCEREVFFLYGEVIAIKITFYDGSPTYYNGFI